MTDGKAGFIRTEVMGTYALLEAVRAESAGGARIVKAVFVSTDEVYGAIGFPTFADAAFDATTSNGVARPGHDLAYAVDASKLQNDLDWRPSDCNGFENKLNNTVDWYISNRGFWEPVWTSDDFTSYWNRKYQAIAAGQPPFAFYTPHEGSRMLGDALLCDADLKKVLDAWREAFWHYRDDVGFGDSFTIENQRLEKNLRSLEVDLRCRNGGNGLCTPRFPKSARSEGPLQFNPPDRSGFLRFGC